MAQGNNKSNSDMFMRKLSFLGFGTDGNGKPDEVQLDAEMEKVFAVPGAREHKQDKFDMAQLVGGAMSKDHDSQRSKDYDSDSYRSQTYQHSVRKPILSAMKRKDSKDSHTTTQSFDTSSAASTATGTPVTSPQKSISIREESNEEAILSERAGRFEPHSDSDTEERRVQFDKAKLKIETSGENIIEEIDIAEDDNEDKEKKKYHKGRHQHYKRRKSSSDHHHHHHHHRHLSPDATPNIGDNASSNMDNFTKNRRVSVQPEDAFLKESHIDDLISHRLDDPRALRRYRIQPQSSEKIAKRESQQVLSPRKQYDHSPHEVFVQLDELQSNLDEWKETARWIKYEEDVEEGADRWGRPHVAPLSFHSLLNLRLFLEQGVVLLDLEERDFPGVAYKVIEMMSSKNLIHHDDKPKLLRALLLRHRHVNENTHGFPFGSRRKFSSYTSLQNLSCDSKPKIISANEINGHAVNYSTGDAHIDLREETYSSSQEDLKRLQNDTILKRIPRGAEATSVLVGSVDFLSQPTGAFVRLAEAIQIPGITEVPIPVRFIFILMGPKLIDMDYHEVGRSIATLMSNDSFHNIAYKAEDRQELLSAINEFLDDSIVLPPGNWQREDLLPFEELKAKSEWIRSRKAKALQLKNKEKTGTSSEDEKKLLDNQEVLNDRSGICGRKKRNPLEKTNRLWGGLLNDIKRRYPMFKSDFTDGLNSETLAATIFMYFAALSTAITFGGLCSEKTENSIGIPETLLAASVVGIVFHLLAGQPLTIIGTTGPLVLLDEALYQFCGNNGLQFLTVRLYMSLWLGVIALIVSAFEGSVYVRLFTRFTQEIFSALITLIYIFETISKLFSAYERHPLLSEYLYRNMSSAFFQMNISETAESLNETQSSSNSIVQFNNNMRNLNLLDFRDSNGSINQPNTALFCSFLTLGTFIIAYFLRIFRNSHFLGRTARRALGDFGVPISIAIFVLVDFFVPAVFTEKLHVPEGLSPSDTHKRNWLIPMGNIPIWLPFAAGIPAILVYILVFMETHISELIVDKPERGLKKGSGLHLDIVLLCFLNIVCGFFGMPWHCAATVRSVTHVSAVTIMSRTHAPGDKPHITDVKEQRVSGLCVSILVGLSATAAPLLRQIPMSVLFGVFLYMGIASMTGVQFFERLALFFMPSKYHPPETYVRRVPTWKMHLFTVIQVIALIILWVIKSSKLSLAFPFVLIMMVPLRQRLSLFFNSREMNALDGSNASVDPNDEPDFYEQAIIPA